MFDITQLCDRELVKFNGSGSNVSQPELDIFYEYILFIQSGIQELICKNEQVLSYDERVDLMEDLIIKSDFSSLFSNMLLTGGNESQNLQIFDFYKSKLATTYVDVFISQAMYDRLLYTYTTIRFYQSDMIFVFHSVDKLKTDYTCRTSNDAFIHKTGVEWWLYTLKDYTKPGDVRIYREGYYFFRSPEYVYVRDVYVTDLPLVEYFTDNPNAIDVQLNYYPYLAFEDPLLYEKDVCIPCREKLKWINLYLQCPTCRKIYG